MNRKRLAIIAGIVILVSALMLMFWPDSQVDTHADEEVAETELPEGLVLIEQEQIRTAEIEVALAAVAHRPLDPEPPPRLASPLAARARGLASAPAPVHQPPLP